MPKNNRFTTFTSNAFLFLISIVVTLTLIEVGARVWLRNFASPDDFKYYASARELKYKYGSLHGMSKKSLYSPHRYLSYYPTPNYKLKGNKHNSLGFRGEEIRAPKPEGLYRIVAIGGSTTYGNTKEIYQNAYPYRLQEDLLATGRNIEVVNAGVANYTSFESIINFEFRVLDLKPDMIIIYHAINDVGSRLVWPPSAYRGDNSGARLAPITDILMPGVWHYSDALRILLIRLGLISTHNSMDLYLVRHPKTYYKDRLKAQIKKRSYPRGLFLKVPLEKMLKVNNLRYFERNIRNIISMAQLNNIQTVLVTFAYSPLFTSWELVSPEYKAAIDEGNDTVRQIASSSEVFMYDFARVMPDDAKYYIDGYHFTALGNKLRAKMIAKYLIANILNKK